MRRISILNFIIVFLLYSLESFSQSNFSVEAYKEFLQTHSNMNSEQLLQMYSAGNFLNNLNLKSKNISYLDSAAIKYGLTTNEIEMLQKNGFVVSERLNNNSFGDAFLDIFHKDLPVFISTDAILHAFHISYDRILRDAELGYLIGKVKSLLQTLHSNQNFLALKYNSNPQMKSMLKDVDVYLTVPLRLFELNVNPYYSENNSKIDSIIQMIADEKPNQFALFADHCRNIDWSQFIPRGHYFEDENTVVKTDLPKYFKVMMWFGRTEIYLYKPLTVPFDCYPDFNDVRRQIIDAYLIRELVYESAVYNDYQEIENVIKIFAGEQDNVTLDNLSFLKNAVSLNNADELLDSLKVVEFKDSLMNQSFAQQKILSQILYANPMNPDGIVPASAFMLFGQRFVIDSYITSNVVYDKIGSYCRLFPSLLDILFALGNSASAQLLVPELDVYHYSRNLAALRYLIDSYDEEFWQANLYSNWLNIIRKLNPPQNRTKLPAFMQTAGFWQEKMNTQLASWTELRHDNLLYAKQSYTGGNLCSFPYCYVEPFPEFYRSLKDFSLNASQKFQSINFNQPEYQMTLTSYFNYFYGICDTLESIAAKEINSQNLTEQEAYFLKKVVYENPPNYGPTFDGWYPGLFYKDAMYDYKGFSESDHLVADMHTTPTDCSGNTHGWVKHVGTGPINLGVFVASNNYGLETAFVGPVMSYYEYTTEKFLRLTDQEWSSSYLQAALRPSWVNLYLADSMGNSRGSGPNLLTNINDNTKSNVIPKSELLISNYPNPFNPSTIIWFNIPVNLTNSLTELAIYDVNGELVKTLVNDVLSSGNYLVKWNGQNIKGVDVSSGIYFYNLKVADKLTTGKMVLMR